MPSGFTKNLRSLRKRSFLGQIVITLLSLELLFFASFISVPLPTPTSRNIQLYVQNTAKELFTVSLSQKPELKQKVEEQIPFFKEPPSGSVRFGTYVPLLPIAVALGYIIGSPLILIVTGLYLMLGLLGNNNGLFLFASGGGTSYINEPGFGYLLGIMGGAWFAGFICPDEERKSWRQILASVVGVLIVHAIGLSIVFGSSIGVLLFEGEQAYLSFQPWLSEQLRNLSWYTLPYDLLFATMLIALVFPLRLLFTMLMSPDISSRHRPRVDTQLEVLQESGV